MLLSEENHNEERCYRMCSSIDSADLTWLPSNTDEQLALGLRIISNAYKVKVGDQEVDIRALKTQLLEKNEQINSMQKKVSSIEVQLIEANQRASQLAEENKQLVVTAKKLQRDIMRLEGLKKAVLTSIQEDRSDSDDGKKFYSSDDILQNTAPRTMKEIYETDGYLTPGQTINSTKLSNSNAELLGCWSCNSPSHNYANNSSRLAASDSNKRMDGKSFFRAAKDRLSYEKFNMFLSSIKRLNNHEETREETLRHAQQLFGEENNDLHEEFKQLLINHS